MLYNYYLAVDLDGIVSRFAATFESEEDANRFADSVAEYLVEFSFVQMVDRAFVPPF